MKSLTLRVVNTARGIFRAAAPVRRCFVAPAMGLSPAAPMAERERDTGSAPPSDANRKPRRRPCPDGRCELAWTRPPQPSSPPISPASRAIRWHTAVPVRGTAWPVATLAAAALAMLFPAVNAHGNQDRPALSAKALASRGGEIHLTVAQQRHLGIVSAPLQAVTEAPTLTAYGSLEADPASTYVLSPPVPGIVISTGQAWQIGRYVPRGTRLMRLEPVISPSTRVSIMLQLAKVKADAVAAQAALRTAAAAYHRARRLYGEQQAVSRQSVQVARAAMVAQQARLAADNHTVAMISQALRFGTRSQAPLPLIAAHSGVITRVLVRSGEFVAANQPLLKIRNFHRLLAELALPPNASSTVARQTARIKLLGQSLWLVGKPIGLAPRADLKTRGLTALYLVRTAQNLRPNLAITGYLPLPGRPTKGVRVPRSAVVWRRGERWLYVRSGSDSFRPVMLRRCPSISGGFFVARGLRAGQMAAVKGIPVLLSLQLSHQSQPVETSEASK